MSIFKESSISMACNPSDIPTTNSSPSFSIASPVVTGGFPLNEALGETSYIKSSSLDSYHDLHPTMHLNQDLINADHGNDNDKDEYVDQQGVAGEVLIMVTNNSGPEAPHTSSDGHETAHNQLDTKSETGKAENRPNFQGPDHSSDEACHMMKSYHQADEVQSKKKRTKATKKGTKLDAKSKLEKSRQSARECRARKKLRYQYLEDLVCNREKAVVKLREELAVFSDYSHRIDVGILGPDDRRTLSELIKENGKT